MPVTGSPLTPRPLHLASYSLLVASFVSYVTSPPLAGSCHHGLDFVMSPSETRHVNARIVTAAVMLATFMEILDTTVVNVSVPHMAGNLGATVEEGT